MDTSTLRAEVTDDLPTNMDLPEQGGGSILTLLPGVSIFQLPSTLGQCWEAFDDLVWQDAERKFAQIDPKTGAQQVIQRIRWKFDKDNPLLVVESASYPEMVGQPVMCTVSNVPRKRSKKPDVPKVSDATYLLRESLGDSSPIATPADWIRVMAAHAGHTFKAEHGLSATCNPEKVRYIGVQNPADGSWIAQEDPTGQKGCAVAGAKVGRFYTDDFKVPNSRPVQYSDRRFCGQYVEGKGWQGGCGAFLRGFFRLERFLKK